MTERGGATEHGYCHGCTDCKDAEHETIQRIIAHAKRGRGITLTKEETKMIAAITEDDYGNR